MKKSDLLAMLANVPDDGEVEVFDPTPEPLEPLALTKRDLNALARTIELAWHLVKDQAAPLGRTGSKDQFSVWNASAALNKIKAHPEGKQ